MFVNVNENCRYFPGLIAEPLHCSSFVTLCNGLKEKHNGHLTFKSAIDSWGACSNKTLTHVPSFLLSRFTGHNNATNNNYLYKGILGI